MGAWAKKPPCPRWGVTPKICPAAPVHPPIVQATRCLSSMTRGHCAVVGADVRSGAACTVNAAVCQTCRLALKCPRDGARPCDVG